jgi:hypothetical protein
MRYLLLSTALVVCLAVPAFAGESTPVLESDLFAPEALQTASCWSCVGGNTTSPGGGAASHWGLGSSCTDAQASLTTQTRTAALNDCWNRGAENLCGFTVVVTAACWWNSGYGQYVVDGYANYSCKFWRGGPGCIIP